jgi:uncharacterized membrane protein
MELFSHQGGLFILRWIHFLAGITWIGMLYYFNFVQTPFFGTELGGQARSAMTRGLVPNALWWFRWGAMFTFLSGWLIVFAQLATAAPGASYYSAILTGGALGSFMWYNVWFVIWPRQKLAIASAEAVAKGGQADPQAAAQAPVAGRASRTNTLFSIPMLFFMGAASHFNLVDSETPAQIPYFAVVLLIILALEANIFVTTPAHKPLGSVAGTLWMGFILSAVLYAVAVLLL